MDRYIFKIKQLVLFLALCIISTALKASEGYMFRLYLSDKGGSQMQVSEAVNEPLYRPYIEQLEQHQASLVTQSRWFNTVVLAVSDSSIVEQFKTYSFVDSARWVWKGDLTVKVKERAITERAYPVDNLCKSTYGYAADQIELHRGDKLHDAGYRGDGLCVAVIDAGFKNVDRIGAFDSLRLEGTYNFVTPNRSVFEEDDHGTKVLSCMAANIEGIMVGTAPNASYWLLKTEDPRSEYPIEEDYWVAAVEFADSVGVDVITSSLGYFEFDNKELEYPKSALNGQTTFISRAAAMASRRGILLFSSAGNEGNGRWKQITFPADAANVITVGAVTASKERSRFSSFGLTADQRVKPDVVAMGSSCCVINSRGGVSYVDGTSFSTPILAGLATCLWQALPHLSNIEMIELIQQMGDQYKKPDHKLGYGLPDIYKAYRENRKKAAAPIK
jgi:subtilisin family serine protease